MLKNIFSNKIYCYVFCGALAIVLSFLLFAVFAVVFYFFDLNRAFIPFVSTLSVALGCFLSCFFAAYKIGEKGYLIGLIIGGGCFFVITVISFALNKSGFTLNTLFHFLIVILSAIVGGILGVNKAGNNRYI